MSTTTYTCIRLELLSTAMADRYAHEWDKLQLATAHVGDITEQRCVVVFGTIMCESEGDLTEASMLLQGISSSSKPRECQLWLNKVPKWCAYAGQVVAVVGECEEGMALPRLLATDFVSGLPISPPTINIPDLIATQQQYNGESVHIAVATGPFQGKPNDEPLDFLLKRFRIDQPHVVIFLGPFVETAPADFSRSGGLVDEMYINIFNKIGDFARARVGKTKVIVVPGLKDWLHSYPLPQPPLVCSLEKLKGVEDKYVEFLSNPGYIKLNELTMCITSADILEPIVGKAVFHGPGALRKVEKTIDDMQKQYSLFPSLLSSYSVDPSLAHLLHFPVGVLPHISVFASTACPRPHVQPSGGRMFVNCAAPMCSGADIDATGGYVNIFIAPPLPYAEQQTEQPTTTTMLKLQERLAVEFVRPTTKQS
eukprot:GHVS01042872.1.p1 GENE.GHVS01042872.1~~GHVS01042872.1.p1  ORF type:complete len:424 (+),score=61.98 GHVS01042872.1:539-1810(+)